MPAPEGNPNTKRERWPNWTTEAGPALVAFIVGFRIRIFPNISCWIWGNDFGMYYFLSNSYLNIHSLVNPPPSPWGIDGYQYFQITYLMVDAVSKITGLPVMVSMKFVIPILGSFTPFLIYFIARELRINRWISFAAALLLAVDPVQLFQTSQANYLTTGHFFRLLSMLFFFKYHHKNRYYVPALISSLALILAHQLSSYIYLISLIGVVVSVQLYNGEWKRFILRDFIPVILTGSFLLVYLIFRVPRSKIFLVNAALGMGLPWIVLSFLIVVLSILFMIGKESACCSLGRITAGS